MPPVAPPLIHFRDPVRAARTFAALHETFITSGSVHPVDQFARALEGLLASSPDPDLALVNFLRFVEATFSKASLFNDLVQFPPLLELLLQLFGSSRYLADILVREPELFRWLTMSEAMARPVEREELDREFQRLRETFSRPERLLDAIKRVHRRAILRIGAQDLMGLADLASVTVQLSDLADAVTDAVLGVAFLQMQERYEEAPPTRFAVLALGKLGGRELNFSSDIDVMFVYGEEGALKDRRGRESSHHEFFNRLSELLVQGLTQPTTEGHLYRVDTRLRPESGAGPLARSMRSFLVYYEARGEIWERQMLIKARPAAGSRDLGAELIGQFQPFVYPRTFFQHPAEAIARIKARIEAKVGDEQNIKLRAGGIRDIEFIVQALQLLNGGKQTEVRESNTLRAIRALGAAGLLSSSECVMLTEAYTLFRTLEHRLQVMANTQTHTVPDDAAALEPLAKRLGFPDGPALREALAGRLRVVRALFDQVMSVRPATQEPDILDFIDGSLGEEAAVNTLGRYGLTDLRAAVRAVRQLTGTNLTGEREMDARTRAAFRNIAPDLFRELSGTPDPDLTLKNLTDLLSAQSMPRQLYDALADQHLRRLLLDIAAMSPRLARGLARSPMLLDTVIADVRSLAEGTLLSLPRTANLVEFKGHQELRAGLRYILGFASLSELTVELTQLAEFILGAVLKRLARRPQPVALFGLGKFGTRELIFDADLDLLFLSAAAPATRQSSFEKTASQLLQTLSSVSDSGRLYEADARLRPEGRSAPLVTSLPAYAEYLRRRASLWERQSLIRARLVAGDPTVGAEATRLMRAFVFDSPLPANWVAQTAAMRRKMETRTRTRGAAFVDIKLGPGGMADIEFIVQMLQLRYGGSESALRFGSTPELLSKEGLPGLAGPDRTFLLETYLWYRRIETLLRLTLEERSALLPEGAKLRTLARCAERKDPRSFHTAVEETMKRVRHLFDDFCRQMESR